MEAQSEQLVVAKLREMGYVPVSVKQRGRSMAAADKSIGGKKVDLRDVAIFSRQLATMVNAGLTIIRALGILAEQTESKALAAVVAEVKGDIERGLSLSQAISKHPKVFPPSTCRWSAAARPAACSTRSCCGCPSRSRSSSS